MEIRMNITYKMDIYNNHTNERVDRFPFYVNKNTNNRDYDYYFENTVHLMGWRTSYPPNSTILAYDFLTEYLKEYYDNENDRYNLSDFRAEISFLKERADEKGPAESRR